MSKEKAPAKEKQVKEIKKFAAKTVKQMIDDIKKNKSTKFSRGDFQALVYAITADPEFKAKKFLYKENELLVEEEDVHSGMIRFLEKLLKHAGVKNEEERKAIAESFKYTAKDVEFATKAVTEAMYLYTDECGKNLRVFQHKALELAFKKIARKGKYEGKNTFKKTVKDKDYEYKNKKK